MTIGAALLSVHDTIPSERGGQDARQGFRFQDHAAVSYLIEMLGDGNLLQVWCEVHDDITLIWQFDQGEVIEYVQAKHNDLDQYWTAAKLYQKETVLRNPQKANGNGKVEATPEKKKSIFEKSLSNDRHKEPCWFRIVVAVPIKSELDVLTMDRSAPERDDNHEKFKALANLFEKNCSGFVSAANRGYKFWLQSTVLQYVGPTDQLELVNKARLEALLDGNGDFLVKSQRDGIYKALVELANEAAFASFSTEPERKKITRAYLEPWFQRKLRESQRGAGGGSSETLRHKMKAADLNEESIEIATDQRRRFRFEQLTPKYLSTSDLDEVEGEVEARLSYLLGQLDAGSIQDDGPAFHSRCLEEVRQLANRDWSGRKVSESLLQGLMYDITNRCWHRFARVGS